MKTETPISTERNETLGKPLTTRVDHNTYLDLLELCRQERRKPAEILRFAIENYLNQYDFTRFEERGVPPRKGTEEASLAEQAGTVQAGDQTEEAVDHQNHERSEAVT